MHIAGAIFGGFGKITKAKEFDARLVLEDELGIFPQ